MRWAPASIVPAPRSIFASAARASAYPASRSTAWMWWRWGGGKGPTLLDLKTYRYRGHSMSDPAKYRSRDEVQAVREKSDPIEHAKKELEAAGVSEDELKKLEKDIRAQVAEAADFAE